MKTITRLGSISLIGLGLLNVFRIFPILLTKGVTPDQVPPHTLADTVFIAQTNAYLASHIMALLGTPLAIFGFYSLYQKVKKSGNDNTIAMGLFAFIGLVTGQVLYSLGLIIDGFALPALISDYVQNGANESSHMASVVMGIHQLAMAFAGIGFFTLLISSAFFGLSLFKVGLSRVLSILLASLGVLAFLGYTFGLLDPMIGKSFELTYGALTLMYVLYLSIGIQQLKTTK